VPTADHYRRLAAECLDLVPSVSPDLRGIFVALAQGWTNLAERLDRPAGDILPDPVKRKSEN
jgi:hypothetical protein